MSDRTCSIEGCERRHYSHDWCKLHYERWKRTGDPESGPICSIQGCNNPQTARGWCRMHYQRWWKQGDPGDAERLSQSGRGCSVDGCSRPHEGRGFCRMHRTRLRRSGEIGPSESIRTREIVGVTAAHHRIKQLYGKATEHICARCGGDAAEWAYDHLDQDELVDARSGHPYSLKPDHYMPLCKSCHRWFDRGVAVAEGQSIYWKRSRLHKRGDHSMCRPERNCEAA